MKLWNRIKYELLRWLLDDICEKSECRNCKMDQPSDGNYFYPCAENYVFIQAHKVWRIN